MKNNTVSIPCVSRDKRIGSAFNYLFNVIFQTENIDGNVIWDFGWSSFFHPFFIAPLAIYRKNCGKNISCINLANGLSSYFELIRFSGMSRINDNKSLEILLQSYEKKTYIPICEFRLTTTDDIDGMQTVIQNIIEKQSKATSKLKMPLSYLLSELVCNIGQHSNAASGYIFSQYNKTENCINLCIADNGITIHGSYVKAGRYLDRIGSDEAIALRMANEGFSTKDLPDAENRGYGISTSKKMLVDGLNGSFFMLSGGAFHRHDKNGSTFVNLPPDIVWKGTIVLMKIPLNIPDDFNYINYIAGM